MPSMPSVGVYRQHRRDGDGTDDEENDARIEHGATPDGPSEHVGGRNALICRKAKLLGMTLSPHWPVSRAAPDRRRRERRGCPSGLRSTCVISAGLEVISAFGWLEYGRAGIEGGEHAGQGSFGDFSQEGLQLGIGLLDRVHVGAVGWQVSQLGPDRLDEFLDLGSLVAR